ncbi:MAG: DUF2169 family type VI secretion system accessory protein, partial [Planctomycetota bacterium]
WKKTLAVIGNRTWKLSGMSEPEPFTKRPLRWEYSYGGKGYALNPIGRGHEGKVLPNLEDPDRLMTHKKAPARPAGLGPVPHQWPQRWRNLGTYDGKWLREDWPWLPGDFDWQHFNVVGEDQRVKPFLRGDERIRVTHCHPEHPVYKCTLPGWRPRWLVRRETEAGEVYTEARLHLDTLWLDMDAEQVVLTWRAVHPVTDRKLKDLTGHYIACEKLADDPAPMAEHEARFREALAALEVPPPEEEEEEEMPEEEATLAAGEAERVAFETERLDRDERLQAYLAKRGGAHAGALDVLIHGERGKLGVLGPILAYYDGLSKLQPELAEALGPPPMPDEPLYEALMKPEPPWTRGKVKTHFPKGHDFGEQDLTSLDLSGLDLSEGRFAGAILADANFRGTRLAKADLKGADLSGADLTEADLTDADLTAADLTEARLGKARLVGAKLEGTSFDKALLEGADLSGAQGKGAGFPEADLTAVCARESVFEAGVFAGATLKEADFEGADLTGADLTGADGPGVILKGAKIEGLKAEGARFPAGRFRLASGPGPIFKEAVVDEADFFGCEIPRAIFTGASAKKTLFSTADVRNGLFDDAVLAGVQALKVNLLQASFDSADLTDGDFRASNLFQAEFLDAKTEGTMFDQANLKGTKLA